MTWEQSFSAVVNDMFEYSICLSNVNIKYQG